MTGVRYLRLVVFAGSATGAIGTTAGAAATATNGAGAAP